MNTFLLILALAAQIMPSARHAVATLPADDAPAGPSYLLEENWEDASPDGWTLGGGGTVNTDASTTGLSLEGSECLYLDGRTASPTALSVAWTDQSMVEIYFLLRPVTLAGADRYICRFKINGSYCGHIQMSSTGQLLITVGGTASNKTTGTMSVGTTYHVWARYQKGTGADGVGSIAFSTDGIRPLSGSQFTTRTTMNGTADIDQLELTANFSTTGPELYMDKHRVDDATIGDNPQ